MISRREHCPEHEDKTPSLVVYQDGHSFCYSCHAYSPASGPPQPAQPKYQEDLQASLQRISALGKSLVRGLSLPCDEQGYYIVWPDGTYYKKRLWSPESHSQKYRNPIGHTQPLMLLSGGTPSLCIVEGEINALSLAAMNGTSAICSPGSANQLANKRHLPIYAEYRTIYILVDNDAAGASGAIELKAALMGTGCNVTIKLMAKDCNQLLCEGGLREWFETQVLEVSDGVSRDQG